MSDSGQGHQLVFLLIGTFRKIIDELHTYLAGEGFEDARPMHGFVLQAIGADAVSITELGRRLGVSKQAAAKTVRQMELQGLVARDADPADARASLIRRSPRGDKLLRASAVYFAGRQSEWERELGDVRFAQLVEDLATIGGSGLPGDFVGWLQSKPEVG